MEEGMENKEIQNDSFELSDESAQSYKKKKKPKSKRRKVII